MAQAGPSTWYLAVGPEAPLGRACRPWRIQSWMTPTGLGCASQTAPLRWFVPCAPVSLSVAWAMRGTLERVSAGSRPYNERNRACTATSEQPAGLRASGRQDVWLELDYRWGVWT